VSSDSSRGVTTDYFKFVTIEELFSLLTVDETAIFLFLSLVSPFGSINE